MWSVTICLLNMEYCIMCIEWHQTVWGKVGSPSHTGRQNKKKRLRIVCHAASCQGAMFVVFTSTTRTHYRWHGGGSSVYLQVTERQQLFSDCRCLHGLFKMVFKTWRSPAECHNMSSESLWIPQWITSLTGHISLTAKAQTNTRHFQPPEWWLKFSAWKLLWFITTWVLFS